MIAPAKVSLLRWMVLAGSVGVLGAILVVRQQGLPSPFRAYPDRLALEAEKARLGLFGDDVVGALRSELAQLGHRGDLPDGEGLANWRTEPRPDGAGGNRIAYVSLAPSPAWPDVVLLVSRLEEHGGIISLDIRSQGTTRKRGISRVEIVVPGTPGTTRRPAGATSPGAAGPDLRRTVGPGPSLRRQSAKTVRLRLPVPATGAAVVPFRPDPPGRAVVCSSPV